MADAESSEAQKHRYRDIYRKMLGKYLGYLEFFHDIDGEKRDIMRKNISNFRKHL